MYYGYGVRGLSEIWGLLYKYNNMYILEVIYIQDKYSFWFRGWEGHSNILWFEEVSERI